MKLLNVEVVLERDKGLHRAGHKVEVLKEHDDKTTSYAIVSHRWGTEVSYEEMIGLMKMAEEEREEVKQRGGYHKIIKSCEQAVKDGYKWLWIDTCCIDKRSSSELSEAINSMYRWYQNAQVCYAYLHDVHELQWLNMRNYFSPLKHTSLPEWFMRGWTLQELIAPKQVEFFNRDWVLIGSKQRLARVLERVTGIPCGVLADGLAAKRLSVAQIMSWAARRKTTRVEDRAYSLMGLFGVNMPMLYGEGEKAFQRLQLEIIRMSSDHSIFAWSTDPRPFVFEGQSPRTPRTSSVLAEDPSDFQDCGYIRKVEPDEFGRRLAEFIEGKQRDDPRYVDIHRSNRRAHRRNFRNVMDSQQFRTFTVSNAGIQVLLCVIPSRESPSHFKAILACTNDFGLVTIDLVSSGSSFSRTSNDSFFPATYPDFRTLHLAHHQDSNEIRREFVLDDKQASHHGFTRQCTYPREFTRDAVSLSSLTDDLVVIVYANKHARSCFAVGLGYYLGKGWVHVVYDSRCQTPEEDWTDFGRRAYDRMWKARMKHAQSMPRHAHEPYECHGDHFTKYAHLPRSIWAARVVWGRWEMDNFKVTVDVEQCPGCCDGPCRWMPTLNDYGCLGMPGLMSTVSYTYPLILDGWLARLDKCSGQRIALGGYGDYSNGILVCTGNIFEDMRTLGIDPGDAAYRPMVSHVSGTILSGRLENEDDTHITYDCTNHTTRPARLALHQPKGISLPANEHFVLLLKALSTRLSGKHLVTTIIQCSDFYDVDRNSQRRNSILGDDPDSPPDNSDQSTEARVLTPLCTIAIPQAWKREMLHVKRREQFTSIREHFYALVNMVPSLSPLGFACSTDPLPAASTYRDCIRPQVCSVSQNYTTDTHPFTMVPA
ncbi:hypothetical protein EDC04DRAFT_404610 [Pisolithus marmoratus]|nr:hypothetical protein EDC04DRAFT_404610 [Pisolithus marmoratus]